MQRTMQFYKRLVSFRLGLVCDRYPIHPLLTFCSAASLP
jgi:hypothetical protein